MSITKLYLTQHKKNHNQMISFKLWFSTETDIHIYKYIDVYFFEMHVSLQELFVNDTYWYFYASRWYIYMYLCIYVYRLFHFILQHSEILPIFKNPIYLLKQWLTGNGMIWIVISKLQKRFMCSDGTGLNRYRPGRTDTAK